MSTSMSLRPKRDLQFSHCVCDASLAAIKKSSYELDVPFLREPSEACVLALLQKKLNPNIIGEGKGGNAVGRGGPGGIVAKLWMKVS